ncbi:MAG: hypothetical protein AAF743_03130, partial [Planctomycetota bacterium]
MPKRADHPAHGGDGSTPSTGEARASSTKVFEGFEPPGSNFVLTPNQFLDLCVPHCSRGCVRLVGYMIRQILGWSDRNGQPLREQVRVTYTQLVRHAHVSRGALREALDEAVDRQFLTCLVEGRPHRAGRPAVTAEYTLRWDELGGYADTLDDFAGFFTGDGRRTCIPNQFFDHVLPTQPHGVTKIVAAVLRHTVGYTNRYTRLPQETAPLSYRRLMRYAAMDRRTIRRALPQALEQNFIRRVSTGRFRPDAQRQEASVYTVNWRDPANGPKMLPDAERATYPPSVQNRPLPDGPITPPATVQPRPPRRSKNTPTKKTSPKTNQRQQQAAVLLLVEEGLDEATAARLVGEVGVAEVGRQLEWIDQRRPTRNRVGMLRKAIEQRWAAPAVMAETPAVVFARSALVGMSGSADVSVAEPSSADVAAAEKLVERLDGDPKTLGRAFGQRIARSRMFQNPPALSTAVRRLGDRFVAEQRRPAAPSETPEQRRDRLWPAYLQHLRDVLAALPAAERKRFDRWHAEQRRKLETSPTPRRLLVKLLELHDAEEGRLTALPEHRPDVPTFDHWST